MKKQKHSYLNSYYPNIEIFFNESTKLCTKATYSFLSYVGLFFVLMIGSLFVPHPQKIETINAVIALIIILSSYLLCGTVITIYVSKTQNYNYIKNCSSANVIQMLENSYKDEITLKVVEQEIEILNKIIQLKELVTTDLSKNLTNNEKQKIHNMNSTSNFNESFFEIIIAKI